MFLGCVILSHPSPMRSTFWSDGPSVDFHCELVEISSSYVLLVREGQVDVVASASSRADTFMGGPYSHLQAVTGKEWVKRDCMEE